MGSVRVFLKLNRTEKILNRTEPSLLKNSQNMVLFCKDIRVKLSPQRNFF